MIYNNELQNSNNKLQSILETINTLPEAGSGEGGVELPELNNEGQTSDLLAGKELIDSEGNIVTGSMPNNGAISAIFNGLDTKSYTIPVGYTSGGTVSLDNTIDNEVDEQTDLINQIKNVVDNLPEAGSSEGTNIIEWFSCASIPTSYAAPTPDGPGGPTLTDYYIELPSNDCCVLFYNSSFSTCSFGFFDVNSEVSSTYLPAFYGCETTMHSIIEDSGTPFLKIQSYGLPSDSYYAIVQSPSN